ncbi:hypothetical protein [Merismopedia glauca]|nr:hypothetical protein [Merismopedia glauca]
MTDTQKLQATVSSAHTIISDRSFVTPSEAEVIILLGTKLNGF